MRRLLRPAFLLPESRRALVAFAVAAVALAPRYLEPARGDATARVLDNAVLLMAAYMSVYIVLTVVVFVRTDEASLRSWAQREGRGSWMQRYVWGTAPGPGVSITVASIALLVGVGWLPRAAEAGSALSFGVRVGLGVVVLVASWVAVVVSFAVAYHADDQLEEGRSLEFPGEGTPVWSDYVYFSVGVSTTFGTTDVTVLSKAMRRTVTVHALVAFLFNTVIVGAVVAVLVS